MVYCVCPPNLPQEQLKSMSGALHSIELQLRDITGTLNGVLSNSRTSSTNLGPSGAKDVNDLKPADKLEVVESLPKAKGAEPID